MLQYENRYLTCITAIHHHPAIHHLLFSSFFDFIACTKKVKNIHRWRLKVLHIQILLLFDMFHWSLGYKGQIRIKFEISWLHMKRDLYNNPTFMASSTPGSRAHIDIILWVMDKKWTGSEKKKSDNILWTVKITFYNEVKHCKMYSNQFFDLTSMPELVGFLIINSECSVNRFGVQFLLLSP